MHRWLTLTLTCTIWHIYIHLQIQDLVEIKTDYFRGIIAPSNVNNVDITVSANALYGITNAVLSGLVTTEVLDDPEIQVNVNNVDITVSANALYGITNAVLSGLVTTEVLDDPDIQVNAWTSLSALTRCMV